MIRPHLETIQHADLFIVHKSICDPTKEWYLVVIKSVNVSIGVHREETNKNQIEWEEYPRKYFAPREDQV